MNPENSRVPHQFLSIKWQENECVCIIRRRETQFLPGNGQAPQMVRDWSKCNDEEAEWNGSKTELGSV